MSQAFNGLGLNLGNMSHLSAAETCSISAENITGAKGQGGRHAAGDVERMNAITRNVVDLIEGARVQVPETGLIAGPVSWPDPGRRLDLGTDNLHFPLNVRTLLALGISGIINTCEERARSLEGERAAYLRGIAAVYRALQDHVRRHALAAAGASGAAGRNPADAARLGKVAAACAAIAERAPTSLLEAVQLFSFVYVLRGPVSTIGRLDQHLVRFHRQDLATGIATAADALGLLCELWQRFNEAAMGDTLRNIMLGGQDAEGNDATNEMSFLMVEASLAVRLPEPHLSFRLHRKTPPAFLEKVAELVLLGHGQGTMYHDEQLIPALVAHGVPPASARNYCNDGCTEIVIDGGSGIRFVQMDAVKCLDLTMFNGQENRLPGEAVGQYWNRADPARPLKTDLSPGFESGDFSRMTSFAEVFAAFLRQYEHQTRLLMEWLNLEIARIQAEAISNPLTAGTFPRVLEQGVPLEQGGFDVECNMVFSGSVTTAGDGLAAIRKVVFEDRLCTPAGLLDALRTNFAGHEYLRQALIRAPKFGNDDVRVDGLVAKIVDRFCDQVSGFRSPSGNSYWPALFNYLFNDHAKITGATPDGRRWKDPIAENFSPTPGRAVSGPTALLHSIARSPLAKACGTSPAHVSLARSMVSCNAEGRLLVRQLLESAYAMGVCVLNLAIYDTDVLRRAQEDPERHADVVVRVWGYSARFIDLSRDIQEHVIARVIRT